ncbi:MAG: hypothetical protein JXA21_30235 [Anaerolineae bacterium]|nr:hypothetical protein [Anaerolineae bacterium]
MSQKQESEKKTQKNAPKPTITPAATQAEAPAQMLAADSVQTQAAQLGDGRLGTVQRQSMAAFIGRTQGNQHVQRVVKAMRAEKNSDEEEQSAPTVSRAIPKISRAPAPTVSRWAEDEHKYFGTGAAQRAHAHPDMFKVMAPAGTPESTVSTDIPYQTEEGQDRTMSFGEGTMLGGDYTRSPQELAEVHSVNVDEQQMQMTVVAGTNINHFFPLAEQEWRAQHGAALGLAARAYQAFQAGEQEAGAALSQQAVRTEAFALHFMQDSFASGHQYPRALEAVHTGDDKAKLENTVELAQALITLGISPFAPELTPLVGLLPTLPVLRMLLGNLGLTLPDVLTALNGLTKSKVYHDALCALPNGMDMLYGQKFHGDGLRDGTDEPVAQESYNSLAQVVTTISGQPVPGDAATPTPNPGPNTAAVMADPEAGPIWYAVEQSIQGLLAKANTEVATNPNAQVTTGSNLSYPVADILSAWQNINAGGRSKLDASPDPVTRLVMAALQGQENILHNATKEGMTGAGKSTDTDADENILELLKNDKGELDVAKVPGNLTSNQVMMICQALISGACIGNDEHAVLLILVKQSPAVFRAAVSAMGADYLDKGLDFGEWDAFLLACANRYPAGSNLGAQLIAAEKNDDAARYLMTGKALVGGHFEPPVAAGKLSTDEWAGVIRALLSGVTGNADERAILNILSQQSEANFRAIVDAITPQALDSGIDGAEWDTFLLMCANRYYAGSNVGAALIASESNDDAARMLITGANGEPPVQKNRLSGSEWIGVINALLSGRTGDADEDAIVQIVQYMADSGQAGLVNSAIGASKMDGGVDGKQWNQIRKIMKSAGYNWSWWG